MASDLRGYMVSGTDPSEGAVLVFARTAREARRIAWPTIRCYDIDFVDMRVRFLRRAKDAAWWGEGPRVLEPRGCDICGVWYDYAPVGESGLCEDCELDELEADDGE